MKKILLLGSGELGKEFVIACQRLGQYVIAVDSYANAPAMQVAQKREVINMLDGDQLDALVEKYKPDLKIKKVNSKIMNQLSYRVSCSKIRKKGFKTRNNIQQEIFNTLKIFNISNIKN